MSKRYEGGNAMRCEPATELELARIARARETGKVKAPTWYHAPRMPAPIKYDMRQFIDTVPRPNIAPSATWDIPSSAIDAREYVREFERLNNLKPVPTEWVTPEFHAA